ncbi:hypothetical protein ABW19_dt0207197 [Dactylella cylindrospora]|nr:hypothetical protein ABW19_dt0207197 [Dactylella cylindrospora]
MARTAQPARKRPRQSQREPTPEDPASEEEASAPPARRRKSNPTTNLGGPSYLVNPDIITKRPSRRAVAQEEEEEEDENEDQEQLQNGSGLRARRPTGRRRRKKGDSDDEEEEDEEQEDEEDEAGPGSRGVDPVSKLVRLALAMEYQKKPIRRQDISEKVLGAKHKADFKEVFAEAQDALRNVFGFSMVELPAQTEKITLAQQRRQAAAEAQRGGQATEKKKSAEKATVKSWHVINILPEKYRIPIVHAPVLPDDRTVLGIGMIIVAIVYLSSRSLSENTLRRHLRKFGIEDRIPVEGNRETGSMENIMGKLIREGYLVKLKDEVVLGQEQTFTYVIGPRGKLEMGREGVHNIVAKIYEGVDGEVDEGLERRINRAIGMDKDEKKGGEGGEGIEEGERGSGAVNGAGEKGRSGKGKEPARKGGRRRRDSDEEEAEMTDDEDY